MKFLFWSIEGLCADLAWKVQNEGHEVKLHIEKESLRTIAEGFVPQSFSGEADAEWADVIVFDDVLGQGARAAQLREQGHAVVGGTAYTDKLEDDRTFGQEELKRHGISVIPFSTFRSFRDAREYLLKNPGRYVLKPSGSLQNIKRLLFVGEEEDGQDVIHILEFYEKLYANESYEFQLQKRIEGVEIAIGAFFNGTNFLTPINVNFEHKKLFPGNIGPSTGEMGTLMYWSPPNKIFNHTLKKFEETLRKERYVGYIDLNCIVNSRGIYPLEFTSRFGYPTISIQSDGLTTPMSTLLSSLARGESLELKVRKGFQIGVRIVVPPFPYNDPQAFDQDSKDRIVLFKKPNFEGIHIEDVRRVGEVWFVTGSSGVALIVVGSGTTVKQAQAQVYQRIKNVMIPNMYFRSDIGDRWFEDSDRLHAWGYLRDS